MFVLVRFDKETFCGMEQVLCISGREPLRFDLTRWLLACMQVLVHSLVYFALTHGVFSRVHASECAPALPSAFAAGGVSAVIGNDIAESATATALPPHTGGAGGAAI